MARTSKATQSRRKNLSKASKDVTHPQKQAVMPVDSGSDSEYSPEDHLQNRFQEMEDAGLFPGFEDSDDESEDDEIDEEAEAEIRDESTLLNFSARLQEAMDLLQQQEREEAANRSRPKYYNKNSDRTKCRYVKVRHDIKTKNPNFKFVNEYFKLPREKAVQAVESISDNEIIDEVDMALVRECFLMFPRICWTDI
ncbi:hypothetical protein M422DRAFT_54487 [Sphaerobolus stellatus SS14]|uniref:Uncharacterized protein n=1 Tax=Sphaerobolus stellatus (strain SS14) TaxID=990650 RepID=A0A0C9TGZ8_SPHS4|nr:hypothetical protein M422DRAFT_54487 [Sphaerobolus stellatus SS14]